jgi:hypothetical protein
LPLEFDSNTSQITYEGKVVGEYTVQDGRARVRLDITYECNIDEWMVPLSWFASGLSHLAKHQQPSGETVISLNSDEDDIDEEYDTRRLLTEKKITRHGYIWKFNKTDVDPWPSELHGHDYDKHLKLDALTGLIYDVATRQCCKKLKAKKLAVIQTELRKSSDFADRIVALIGS